MKYGKLSRPVTSFPKHHFHFRFCFLFIVAYGFCKHQYHKDIMRFQSMACSKSSPSKRYTNYWVTLHYMIVSSMKYQLSTNILFDTMQLGLGLTSTVYCTVLPEFFIILKYQLYVHYPLNTSGGIWQIWPPLAAHNFTKQVRMMERLYSSAQHVTGQRFLCRFEALHNLCHWLA